MGKDTKIWLTVPELTGTASTTARREACLVHIYPTGPAMGIRYPLGDAALTIGRSSSCTIALDDHATSRQHASIHHGDDGYLVNDLQSTNGTYVNNVRVRTGQTLRDGDYLRVGSCIFRFLVGGNVEAAYHEEIYRLTIIDGLTEVYNKRYLVEMLEHELGRSARYGRPLSLMLFDLDRFKSINDRWGHLCGDSSLRQIASAARKQIRDEDVLARYGGEEFAVLLPATESALALAQAERLRARVEAMPFHYESYVYQVTISVGVATAPGGVEVTAPDLIRVADERLYQAKHGGRNCVVGG